MDLDATQAIPLDDYDDETDEEISQSEKKPVAHLKVACQKGFPETLFPVYEGDNLIGRQEGKCNLCIPIKALSKEHACIEVRGQTHLIYDKGSRNKSRRGKLVLTPEVRYELQDKDPLTFADVTCTYLIEPAEQQICQPDDSGSETGSESMLPDSQMPAQSTKRSLMVNDTVMYEDKEENDDDEASSDILQPTQVFAEAGDGGGMLHKPALMSTLMYAEDSEEETLTSGQGVPFSKSKGVVQETPYPRKTTKVLPESDHEDEKAGEKPSIQQTLVYDEEEDDDEMTEEERRRILEEPTQAYVTDSGEETDDGGGRIDEDICNMATQAYPDCGLGDDPSDDPSSELDQTVDPAVLDEPTQAYEDVTSSCEQAKIQKNSVDLDPTQVYPMNVEEKVTRSKSPSNPNTSAEDATQAYDMDTEITMEKNNNQTSAEEMEATQNFSDDNKDTQTSHVTGAESEGDLKPCGADDSAERSEVSADTMHIFEEPTQAYPDTMQIFEEPTQAYPDPCENTAEKNSVSTDEDAAATQAFEDGTQMLEEPTQAFPDQPGDGDKSEKEKDNDSAASTQDAEIENISMKNKEIADDDTQAVGHDSSLNLALNITGGSDFSAPTQVFDDQSTQNFQDTGKPHNVIWTGQEKDSAFGGDDIATQAYPDEGATQAYPDEGSTQAETQKIMPSASITSSGKQTEQATKPKTRRTVKRRSTFDEDDDLDATQNFPDPVSPGADKEKIDHLDNARASASSQDTQVLEDSSTVPVTETDGKVNSQATGTVVTLAVSEDDGNFPGQAGGNEESEDATLDLNADAATQAFPDAEDTPQSEMKSKRTLNENVDTDQVAEMDAPTLALVDDAPLEKTRVDTAAEEAAGAASNKRGRKKGRGKQSVNKDSGDQQVASVENVNKQTPVTEEFGSPVFGKVPIRKRTDEDDYADAPTQVFGEVPVSEEIGDVRNPSAVREDRAKSPLKSALASPKKSPGQKSPPKKVVFLKQSPDSEETETAEIVSDVSTRGRKGRAPVKKESPPDVKAGNLRTRGKKKGKTTKPEDEGDSLSTVDSEGNVKDERGTSSEITQAESASGKRAEKISPKTNETSQQSAMEMNAQSTRGGRRGRRSVVKKNEAQTDGKSHEGGDGQSVAEAREDVQSDGNTTAARKDTQCDGNAAEGGKGKNANTSQHTATDPGAELQSSSNVDGTQGSGRGRRGRKSVVQKGNTDLAGNEQKETPPVPPAGTSQNHQPAPEKMEADVTSRGRRGRKSVLQKDENSKMDKNTTEGTSKESNKKSVSKTEKVKENPGDFSTNANKITGRGRQTNSAAADLPQMTAPVQTDVDKNTCHETSQSNPAGETDMPVVDNSVNTRKARRVKTKSDNTENKDSAAATATSVSLTSEEQQRGEAGRVKPSSESSENPAKNSADKTDVSTKSSRGRGRQKSQNQTGNPSTESDTTGGTDEKLTTIASTAESGRPKRSRKSVYDRPKQSADNTSENASEDDKKSDNLTEKRSTTRKSVEQQKQKDESKTDEKQKDKSKTDEKQKDKSKTDEKQKDKSKTDEKESAAEASGSGEQRVSSRTSGEQRVSGRTSGRRGKQSEKTTDDQTQPSKSQEREHLNKESQNSTEIEPSKTEQSRGRKSSRGKSSEREEQEENSASAGHAASSRSRRTTAKQTALPSTEAVEKHSKKVPVENEAEDVSSVTSEESISARMQRKLSSEGPSRGQADDSASVQSEESNDGKPKSKRSRAPPKQQVLATPTTSKNRRATIQPKLPVTPDSNQGSLTTEPERKRRKTGPAETPPATPRGSQQSSAVSSPTTPSLRRKSIMSKPKVLFTGVVDDDGQKIVKDLGGSMASTIYDCSHLVTDKLRRTVKFLCGLARGLPIVTMDWIQKSKAAGRFLDAGDFIINDKESEKTYHFKLAESIEKATERPLLTGFKVHATKSVKPEPPQMKDIVKCAQGQYLDNLPRKFEENVVVVSCEGDRSLVRPALDAGIPVVSAEFLLTGILKQQLDINIYRIMQDDKASKRPASSAVEGSSRQAKKGRR